MISESSTGGKQGYDSSARSDPLFLLAVNQSISHLFRDVIDEFSQRGVHVTVLAGRIEMERGYLPTFTWLRACALQKAPAWRRLWTWGRFTLQFLVTAARHRGQLALVTTNPPLVQWVAPLMRRLFGLRYALLIYDIYPDVMERLGLISEGGLMSRFFRRLSSASYQRAECVITLGDCMKETIKSHLRPGQSLDVHVIPSWANTNQLRPVPRDRNPFTARYGLADKFVVMYSGAFGATHGVEGLVALAEALEDLGDVRVVLIGGGTREKAIKSLVARESLPNLLLLPWQPVEELCYSLGAADCHVITLDTGFEGISVPSKTYTAMAVGGVLLAVSPVKTTLAEVVDRHQCGIVVPPRNPAALAKAVRALWSDRDLLQQMKANSRQAAEMFYSTSVCSRRYYDLLRPGLGCSQPGISTECS